LATKLKSAPRSGLAAKQSVTVLNSPGTIDADYRGEIKVILINHGQTDFTITRGERIAQMVVAKYEAMNLYQVNGLDKTSVG
jgi:dUTP pyrophosphatase